MRFLLLGSLLVVFIACTGGPGPIDQTGNGSSGLTSSSGGSSSGEATGGGGGGGSGGGGTTAKTVQASEFDQSCESDGDCVVIYEGSVCDACKCANAAIATSAFNEYASKAQGANCPTTDVACAADCAEVIAKCSSGQCTVTGAGAPGGG